MKTFLLALLTLTVAFEAAAQIDISIGSRRGGVVVRDNRRPAPGRVIVRDHRRPGPVVVRDHRRPGPVVVRDHRRPGPVIVRDHRRPRAQPRYVRNQYSRRVIRVQQRPRIQWRTQFGYACTPYGQLLLNGQTLHNFQYSQDCHQAVQDIRDYGDFCDGEDLYDQSGNMEAQFSFDYECREALGYYY